MTNWNEIKNIILPRTVFKFLRTVQFLNDSSSKVSTALGNEGLNLKDWIQTRIDDGDIVIPSTGGNTDLDKILSTNQIEITSSTGTSAILQQAVASNSSGVGGQSGIVTNTDKYRIDRALLAISSSDLFVGYSTGTNPIQNTATVFIINNAVTNAKAADMPSMTIKGNNTLISGDPKDLTVAEVQTMLGLGGPGTGNGIYGGDGTVPTGTVATLTDSFGFIGTDLTNSINFDLNIDASWILRSTDGTKETYVTGNVNDVYLRSENNNVTATVGATFDTGSPYTYNYCYNNNDGQFTQLLLSATDQCYFRDNRTIKVGLEYFADYSANYTNRSLIDKQYVDNLITALPTSSSIYTGSGSVPSNTFVTIDNGINFVTTNTATFGINIGNLSNSEFEITDTNLRFSFFDLGGDNSITIDGDGLLLKTTSPDRVIIRGNDARYFADYSGTFTARSLVDKGYVDSLLGAGVPAGTDTQTLRFNGTVLEASSLLRNNGTSIGINQVPTVNNKLSVNGSFGTKTWQGIGTAPTVTLNSVVCGSGATYSIIGTDIGFRLSVTMGTGTLSDNTNKIGTITLSTTFNDTVKPIFSAGNANASGIALNCFTENQTASDFDFSINSSLGAGTIDGQTFIWNFIIIS